MMDHMKTKLTNSNRFVPSLVLAALAFCLAWAAFAHAQGDPVRCKKLLAIGERLQVELEELESRLNNPEHEECQGLGERICRAQIKAKQEQIAANRRLAKVACADLPTPTPTPTPEPTPGESPQCTKLKAAGVLLREQLEKLREKLNNEECQGPAITICQARIRAKQAEIEANLRLTKIACGGAPAPTPTPAPIPGIWIPVGPAPQAAPDGTQVSGRVTSIAISSDYDGARHPAMFIGTLGGIWRSTNFTDAAPIWHPLTDHLALPVASKVGLLSINSVVVDEKNPRHIFAASGDPAQGVLRSLDGGNTWILTGQETFGGTWPIGKIIVDPTDGSGNTLYLSGGAAGIYKTFDGGDHWFPRVQGLPSSFRISDLDYTVGSGQTPTLYASVSYAADGKDKGIWASTDGAFSWIHLRTDLVDIETGLVVGPETIGLTKLGADHRPGAPAGIYAAVNNASTNFLLNVFRFTGVDAAGVPAGGDLPVPKRVYNQGVNLPIAVSPLGEVYLGTAAHVGLFRSSDQGGHWVQLAPGTNGVTPHVDDYAWAFHGNAVYSGNDGGIWRYNPQQKTWDSLNTGGLQTSLINGVSEHPNFPNVFLVGSQDNGTAMRVAGSWKPVNGGPGDGGLVLFDPDPANNGKFAYTWGPPDPNPNFFFRLEGASPGSWKSIGFFSDNAVPFYSIFSIVPSNTQRLLVPLGQMFESRDRGGSWMPISPPLVSKLAMASAVASSADGQTIYVAYGNKLFRTTNGGGDGTLGNWPEVTIPLSGNITAIAVHPDAASKVYLATDEGQIWQTQGGATWANISGDFPSLRINAIALKADTGSQVSSLFLGTSVGVYTSSSQTGNLDWEPFGADALPDVEVKDLHYNPRTKYLVAGTYGRGVFAAYMHFTTPVPLGATSLGQQLFVFGADEAGKIEVNQATFGQAFSGWFDVQGNGRTDNAPAATTVGASIFVFVKGLGGGVFLNQAEFGHAFSGWFEVQGGRHTDAAPTAATIDKTVFVFVKGLDYRIYLNQADFGHAFGSWFEVQGNGLTDRGPSATSLNKTLFVFMKGLDSHIYLNQADFGHAFGNWFEVQGNFLTDQSPAATSIGNSIFVFAKGLDRRIYLNQAEFGHAFSGWFEVQGGGLTDQAPVATTVGKSVFVFVKGLDGRVYANQAEFGHAFSGWFEVGGGLQ